LPNHSESNITMTYLNPTRILLPGALAVGLLALAPNTQSAAVASATTPNQGNPYSVGLEAGTTGLGGNVAWRFMNNLGVESGFDYFDYSYNGTIKDNTYDAKLRLMSEPLNLEVFPWKRSSFHISLGALFNENRLSGSATGPLTLNGDKYTGNLNLLYKPETVDPYVGIGGNVYFDKSHHWSLMGALGVAYAGDGKVSLTGTGVPAQYTSSSTFQQDLQAEKAKVQSYARDLRFWPVIKLGVTYSF
jgi:hypothetical protein